MKGITKLLLVAGAILLFPVAVIAALVKEYM